MMQTPFSWLGTFVFLSLLSPWELLGQSWSPPLSPSNTNWQNSANWTNEIIPGIPGEETEPASFPFLVPPSLSVTVLSSPSISLQNIVFADSYQISGSSIAAYGSTLTITVNGSAAADIQSNLSCPSSTLTMDISENGSCEFAGTVDLSNSTLTQTGDGTLIVSGTLQNLATDTSAILTIESVNMNLSGSLQAVGTVVTSNTTCNVILQDSTVNLQQAGLMQVTGNTSDIATLNMGLTLQSSTIEGNSSGGIAISSTGSGLLSSSSMNITDSTVNLPSTTEGITLTTSNSGPYTWSPTMEIQNSTITLPSTAPLSVVASGTGGNPSLEISNSSVSCGPLTMILNINEEGSGTFTIGPDASISSTSIQCNSTVLGLSNTLALTIGSSVPSTSSIISTGPVECNSMGGSSSFSNSNTLLIQNSTMTCDDISCSGANNSTAALTIENMIQLSCQSITCSGDGSSTLTMNNNESISCGDISVTNTRSNSLPPVLTIQNTTNVHCGDITVSGASIDSPSLTLQNIEVFVGKNITCSTLPSSGSTFVIADNPNFSCDSLNYIIDSTFASPLTIEQSQIHFPETGSILVQTLGVSAALTMTNSSIQSGESIVCQRNSPTITISNSQINLVSSGILQCLGGSDGGGFSSIAMTNSTFSGSLISSSMLNSLTSSSTLSLSENSIVNASLECIADTGSTSISIDHSTVQASSIVCSSPAGASIVITDGASVSTGSMDCSSTSPQTGTIELTNSFLSASGIVASLTGYTQSPSSTLQLVIESNASHGAVTSTTVDLAGDLQVLFNPKAQIEYGSAIPLVVSTNPLNSSFATITFLQTPSSFVPYLFYSPTEVYIVCVPSIIHFSPFHLFGIKSIEQNMRQQRTYLNMHRRLSSQTPLAPTEIAHNTEMGRAATDLIAQQRPEEQLVTKIQEQKAPPFSIYLGPIGSVGKVRKQGSQESSSFHSIGVFGGFDYAWIPQKSFPVNIGIGSSWMYSAHNSRVHPDIGTSKIHFLHGNIYTVFVPTKLPDLSINAAFGYGHEWVQSTRFSGSAGWAKGKTAGPEIDGNIGLEYLCFSKKTPNLSFYPELIFPILNVQYIHTSLKPFSETGASPFDLHVNRQTWKALYFFLGARCDLLFIPSPHVRLRPNVNLGWQYQCNSVDQSVTFATNGPVAPQIITSTVKGVRKNSLILGLDFNCEFYRKVFIEFDYDLILNGAFTDNAFYLQSAYMF